MSNPETQEEWEREMDEWNRSMDEWERSVREEVGEDGLADVWRTTREALSRLP